MKQYIPIIISFGINGLLLMAAVGCSNDANSGRTEGAIDTFYNTGGQDYTVSGQGAADDFMTGITGPTAGVGGAFESAGTSGLSGMAGVGEPMAGSGGIVGSSVADPNTAIPVSDASDTDGGATVDGGMLVDGNLDGGMLVDDNITGDAAMDTDGSVAGDGEVADATVDNRPPCTTDPSQVVILGDSYVTMYPDTLLEPRIEALARRDGALEAGGQGYRNYSVPGTSMANGQIPGQFTTAVRVDPDIKLVIMDGGGNDVLLGAPQCENWGSASNPACQAVVQRALDTAVELTADMFAAGVTDIVFFGYPHIPPNGLLTGIAPNEILDYSIPLSQKNCESAEDLTGGALRCYFIDTRPLFGDTYRYINLVDGVHPTAAGADLIAEAIYSIMKDNCLGQPESSGCCKP